MELHLMISITISIIVPIYNVENYLDRCVQSLLSQTYRHIEVILVDDGSPDNCPVMCDKYAELDSRIKVIHKPNGGLSDARNTGLLSASGEYILFVDSYDYIDLDGCAKLIAAIGHHYPDIVVGNAKRIENNSESLIKHRFYTHGKVVTGAQYLKSELGSGTMHMMAVSNLYKRKFILINKMEFKIGLLYEDEQFTPRVFLKAEKVIGTDIVFYNYIIREGSITNGISKVKIAEHVMLNCKELEIIYKKINDDKLRILFMDNLVNKFLDAFQIAALYKKEYSNLVDMRFIKGKAFTKRNKLRVALFYLNKRLYYNINKLSKIMR